MTPFIDSPTILIVDDTPSNLSVVVNLFEEYGYRVAIAQDGEEGVQRAQLVHPDLILLDVMMPGIDGFEACRRLKAQESTRDIPVIFMTALADTLDKVAGFNAGGVDYVTKPLRIEEVVARVQTQLNLSAMQKRLEKQNAQLRRYREQLEQRVAERTLELTETNQRMRAEIQERKKAQEALAAREREFRTLAENAPDNICRYDEQCRTIYMNPRLEATLGLDARDVIGKTPMETMPEFPQVTEYQAQIAKVIASGQPTNIEITLPDTGKGLRYYHVSFVAERDAQGEIVGVLAIGRDITEHKETERLLHKREQEFRAAVENSPDIIARYDTHCRRIYVNPAMRRQFGLPVENILGKTPLEFSAMTEAQAYMQRIQSVLNSAKETQMEFSFRDFQGEMRWGHMRLVPEFGTDGAVASVLAITRDITERKYAEEALAAREREFRTLAENMPDNIVRYDLQGRKTYVNSAMARMMGVDPEALLGKMVKESAPGVRVTPMGEYENKLKRALENGESGEIEVSVQHVVDGAQIHNVRFVPEHNAQGAIVGVLTIGRDITARKIAENALKEREQRYREIFDNAVEGMYLLEVTEDGRFRNLDINPALVASTGMPREAMIGQFVDDTVPEDMGKQIVEKYRRCVAAGATITENIELDLPAGKRHYISTITPIYYDGRVHRLIGISRDITELKRAEQALEESRTQLRGLTARREEAREEERKYIAREVHDELGQILTGLQLNVSVLEHKFAAISPELREQLQSTRMLTDRALGVARNVATALRPAALDMGIVSALEWLTGRFSSNTGIQCNVRIEDDEIQLDENHAIALFRIVQESLTNALRHAQAKKIDITLRRDAGDYLLKIRDNGKGFETSEKKMNSFGLVGIRERALMLGGMVTIESSPGKGTEIKVRIPLNINEVKS